jgi:hypothetical protein
VPLRASHRRPRFEVHILPRTAEMVAVEEQLRFSLAAFVGGAWLVVSLAHVSSYLRHHFAVDEGEVRIRRYRAGSFLLYF